MLRFLLPVLLWLAMAIQAMAAESISSYHSDIQVAADGELTVAETITVHAEGRDIRRGIFRDFPLTLEDEEGRTLRVDFEVLSVTRDGEPEEWHTESVAGGVRIYAGSAESQLDRGPYTYVITYRTDRQIRYFDDHDELYWNVTGNGWMFRIEQASARVTLPAGSQVTETVAYTGPLGSADTNVTMRANGNTAVFSTLQPLLPGEGLTVVVGIQKGVIDPPSNAEQRGWWLRDNMNAILGLGGLLVVALYYARNWTRVGRDPAEGVVVPRWDPPDGISPALANYIDNKGFSGGGWTALSASAIDLAVTGYVTLEGLKSSITIRRTDKRINPSLPAGQAALLKDIGSPGEEMVIDKANGSKIQTVGANFRRAIETEHRGKYYRSNIGYVIGGVALSAVALALLFLFGNIEPDLMVVFIVPVFLAAFFGSFAVSIGKRLRRGRSLASKIFSVVILGFFGLVAISILSSLLVMVFAELSAQDHWPLLVSVGGIVLVNVIFFFLMGAPTPLGRKLMDGIEGLRTYLTLAEKDRMNMAGAPQMSPQHFETLLPYAVALGVEKPWSEHFEAWLASAAAGAAAASYVPTWYGGRDIGSFGGRIGGFSSSMASTIASTIPAPKTSSSSSGFSSGGGFSGGGGGGGGGGGW
ncbi:putative membrane protein YgcG [Pseudorhizobium tarimense]|uniref:Membrane protein YgcG n=1 Tax=Pseudorhizobium tarimense TaxID=1079109 RepID=A0ABV2H146_9HYPH|nr:DUF2207 domain-containing protein [Pseudorhizobium tarimense]MCJ8517584.1 DUF2207 domain-containing protein [Pseudorhizobium tarimense]